MALEPSFAKADYPWLGGTSELFKERLGAPHEGHLHGYVCHVFERATYRLTVLYQGNFAVVVHCLYRAYPPWWTVEDDARRFAPRQIRATSLPLTRWLQHERRRRWWTIADQRVPSFVVRALTEEAA